MKFILSTDSSCDCFKSDLKNEDISYVPLTFTINGETFPDAFDSDYEYKDFYSKIRSGAMPTTSQVSPEIHYQYFAELYKQGAKSILHLCLSSGLSSTYQSACLAANDIKRDFEDIDIHIVDSLAATQAQNYLLQKAKMLRDSGQSAKEAAQSLALTTKNLQVWILADDLMHLKRGGRVSAAAAIIGTVLNIKPILVINSSGGLSVVHKSKGIKKAISYFCDKAKQLCPNFENAIFFTASADGDDKIELLKKQLYECGVKGEIKSGWIGPVIGAHTGPGTIGLVFEGEQRII